MPRDIVCLDSDYDDAVRLVAEWRRNNVYPNMMGNADNVEILRGNLATRAYLSRALIVDSVVYFTASGHGLPDEFTGNDLAAALSVGGFHPDESSGKIIHLLSCHTALILGADLVANNCMSFFGYDVPFTFNLQHLNEFLSPAAEVDFSISSGETSQVAHDRAIAKFDEMIAQLLNAHVDPSIIGDLMTDKSHFCSPVKHGRWGDRLGTV